MSKWNRAILVAFPIAATLVACNDKSSGSETPAATTTVTTPPSAPPPPPVTASASASASAEARKEKPGGRPGGGIAGMMLGSARALDLKADQTAKLDKIDASLKEEPGPPAEMKDLHADVIAGIKAGKVDTAKLEPRYAAMEKSMQARIEKQDDALNQLHEALDPAQRKALVASARAKQAEREAKMAEHKAEREKDKADAKGADWSKKRLERMTKELDLDDAQQKKVEPLLAKQMPTPAQMDSMHADMKKRMDSLLTAFEGDTFDAKKVDAPGAAAKRMREPMTKHTDFLNALLPILKPEQREKLAASMDKPHGRPGMGGPHGGDGRGEGHMDGMMWDDPSEGMQ